MIQSSILTISLPSNGCNKYCPYCISQMTGPIETNRGLMRQNIEKVKTIAKAAGVTSVLITSKGEPLLNMPDLKCITQKFKDWPLELQTNGIELHKDDYKLHDICNSLSLNVIAISIDNLTQMHTYYKLVKLMKSQYNIIVRFTVNISDLLGENITFKQLLRECKMADINHLTIRRISIPNGNKNNWIENHKCDELYYKIVQEISSYIQENFLSYIRSTNYGMKIYNIDEIAVAYSDNCIQEQNQDENIRSLIFQEDGHLYTTWNSKASILF